MPISVADLNLPLRGAPGWDVSLKNAFGQFTTSLNAQETATNNAVGVISGAVDANDAAVAATVTSGVATTAALNSTFATKVEIEPEIVPGAGAGATSMFSGAVMLNRADFGNGVVIGVDQDRGSVFTSRADTLGIYAADVTLSGKIIDFPAGTTPTPGSLHLRRLGNVGTSYFVVLFGATTASASVWRLNYSLNTWTKVLDLTTDGTTEGSSGPFPTTIAGEVNVALVGEYGVPKAGGVSRARVHRSTDGGNVWNVVYEANLRHIHAIERDPFNAGHYYMSTGDGDTAAKVLKSTDFGATWTEVYSGQARYQVVQISFSTNFIWLASDADGVPAVILDRATMTPKIACRNSAMQIAVPGGAPGDVFHSQMYFGAFDTVTQRFYCVTAVAGLYGNRHGVFYIDKPGGLMHLLATLPDDFVPQRVHFYTTGSIRYLYSGNMRLNITDRIAAEATP